MDVLHSWKNYIIDLRLMKLVGLYQLLNPNTPTKPFGYNVFKLAGTLSLLYLTFVIVMCNVSIYYTLYDFTEVVKYTMLMIATLFALIKMYFIIWNSSRLWKFISFTYIDFFPYHGHQKKMLIDAHAVSMKISKIITLGWVTIIIVWLLCPIMIHGNHINVKSKDGTSCNRYRYNMLNLIFPVTGEFYNDNFRLFYFLETIALIVYGYSMMVFDCLVIAMCITITYQLKMIALSYSTLGRNGIKTHSKNSDKISMESSTNEDLSYLNNLLLIIQDHQMLLRNMYEIYNVMRPIILFQLLAESILITLQPFLTVLNLNRGNPLTSPDSIKLISSALTNSIHMFTICYLFSSIDKHKDSINFSLYSSNWTEMSMTFKKLILLAMKINDSEHLKLKVTTKVVVNLELFTSVIHTTYKIISVLVNQYN